MSCATPRPLCHWRNGDHHPDAVRQAGGADGKLVLGAFARPAARPVEHPPVGAVFARLPGGERLRRERARGRSAELAAAFATASIDKFADVLFGIGLRGYPILHGSIAVFECQTENTVEGGDHLIFIGRVVAASYCDGEPLVFSRGEYCVPVRHAPPPERQRLHV